MQFFETFFLKAFKSLIFCPKFDFDKSLFFDIFEILRQNLKVFLNASCKKV